MGETLVLPGPSSQEFGKELAKRLALPLLATTFTEFADGETRFKFDEKVEGTTILLVQSTHPPVDKHYMQLFLAAHYLSQDGAKVHAVIPCMGYARQDKQFLPGEVVSFGVISHLLRSAGVARVTTVDIHSAEALALFSIPLYSVSAIPSLARHIKNKVRLTDPLVVAPDFGSSKRTEAFAALYGAKFLQLKKERDRKTGKVNVEASELEVKGRDVVIVDDMISTGGTVMAAAEVLHKAGAGKIVASCVHALLVGDAYEKLLEAGIDEIIGTTTVPSRVSTVDATEPVAAYLRTLSA